MDEITLVNLLNKICETNTSLSWQINCKYNNGTDTSIMEVHLFEAESGNKTGWLVFRMENGKVLNGKYKSMVPFDKSIGLVDALLEILHYEATMFEPVMN